MVGELSAWLCTCAGPCIRHRASLVSLFPVMPGGKNFFKWANSFPAIEAHLNVLHRAP